MKNYLALILTFCFYSGMLAQTKADKPVLLEQMHWLIERSGMNTVQKRFQKICNDNCLPKLVSGLKDGIYKGASPADDYGYRHEVTFEMKNGKMISIDYDEVHTDGHAKQHNIKYGKRMLISGTTPAIAYPKYESEMLEKQNLDKVDAVSGASYSLYRFKLAILYAMLNSGQL